MPRTTCTIRSTFHSSSGVSHGRSRNVGLPGRAKSWKEAGTPAAPLLDRTRQQALGEVTLERQEHAEGNREREEGRRCDQLDVRAELTQLREDRDRDRLGVAAVGQRDDEVVPGPEELEDRKRCDRRQAERQDQPEED